MTRGDLVTVSLPGDSGKPRPALVIAADAFHLLSMVALLPLTSTIVAAALTRIDLAPTTQNGLHAPSQIVVHRVTTVRRDRVGSIVGHVDDATMVAVNRSLAVFLGLA